MLLSAGLIADTFARLPRPGGFGFSIGLAIVGLVTIVLVPYANR